MERLAPAEGLFLSRLINPPSRWDDDTVTTVWITARGPLQYVLDSIRICDYEGPGLGPSAGVSMGPDAEYRFGFAEGSDRVHALNPALSVGPETRDRATFNLALGRETPLYTMGTLRIWVRYHASDDRVGTIVLNNPPADAERLARMLGGEV